MKLYFDACCLNRPFDDQEQTRIRLESEAILLILRRLHTREWDWISSDVLLYEIDLTPDTDRRQRVRKLADFAHLCISINEVLLKRAEALQSIGFDAYDALHLSCAKAAQVDVFLTTDDRIVKIADREKTRFKFQVANPLQWLEELDK